MTVSQSRHEILWEPQEPREAVDDTLASLRVDGLEPSPFAMAIMQRIADGEIDEDQAVAEILAHYRA